VLKGTCIASNQGSPKDYERTEWLQNGGGAGQKVPIVKGGLVKYGITHFDDIYDPSGSANQVRRAVMDGRGIMLYVGHGSSTSWVSSGFNVADVDRLTNGAMLPVIWSVACVNGNFAKVEKCFAEAWLRNARGGAAAMEASSTNESWVPPCDKQAATVNALILGKFKTFGGLEAAGLIEAFKAWGDGDKTEGNKLAEQCNLFGDCTMLVKSKKASYIIVTNERGLDNNVVFSVSNDRAVADATVTVYNQDMSFVVTAETDEQGRVNLSLANAPAGQLFYTVVGQNIIPEVDQPLN